VKKRKKMKASNQSAHISFSLEEMDAAGLCTEADGMVSGLTGNLYITTLPLSVEDSFPSLEDDFLRQANGYLLKVSF
jgi:hypothetical protein